MKQCTKKTLTLALYLLRMNNLALFLRDIVCLTVFKRIGGFKFLMFAPKHRACAKGTFPAARESYWIACWKNAAVGGNISTAYFLPVAKFIGYGPWSRSEIYPSGQNLKIAVDSKVKTSYYLTI